MIMAKFELNLTNIDKASQTVTDFLSNEKVAPKEVQRIRLSVEEILLKYFDSAGDGVNFEVITSKRFRTLKIELAVDGDSIDPFADGEGEGTILNNLLSNFGLAPTWRYKNGKNIIIFTAKKQKKLSQILQLGIAILSAIALGGFCFLLPDKVSDFIATDLVAPVFDTFMGLLSAIAGPIIFLSVVWGICGIGDMATFGKIGKKMIGRFLLVSIIVGAAMTALFALMFQTSAIGGAAFEFSDLYEMILDIIPSNLFAPFIEGNSLQIIFIAIIVGIAMLVGLTMLFLGNRIPIMINVVDQLNVVMQTIMSAVSSFIPFFVFGSIFNMIVGGNLLSVAKSYKLILVMLLGDLVLMAAYLLLVSVRKKVTPLTLFKKLMPTYIIGLTTASAVAAYQTNISTCEKKLGIDKKLIDIGIPLGQVIFMPGAIVLFVAAAFGMAETYGVAITPTWMFTVFIISVILAIAAPPVPGAALTCYTILFMQLGIPTEAIAVVIALNVILEFVATAVNLFCLQTELVELSGSLQTLKTEVLRNKAV